tara:strand:+ start:1460 stop:1657 length:198 start_codon:yes stop_codon:yes gene_type:complete
MNRIKEEFLKESTDQQMLEIAQILSEVERHGLLVEVMYTALRAMKNDPKSSPLLCLQIAAEDWDV